MGVTIRETETAGEFGDYKLMFVYDGTNGIPYDPVNDLIGEEVVAVGDVESTFASQAVKHGVTVVINSLGSNTWIKIGLPAGEGAQFAAVGVALRNVPVANVNQIKLLGDNAANDGKVSYVGGIMFLSPSFCPRPFLLRSHPKNL